MALLSSKEVQAPGLYEILIRARVEEKPEVRKAGGVHYTPEYIVRYIVDNTVGKLIEGKTLWDGHVVTLYQALDLGATMWASPGANESGDASLIAAFLRSRLTAVAS